tara:strand:+ start:156 stop:449 length:294 start_codon:yes stop_codon:yes gene_type:complete
MTSLSSVQLKRKWWQWHKQNPHIYQAFEEYSLYAISRGKQKLSAWLIINRLRWDTEVETTGGEFKISNDFIAYYARLFMALNPEYEGFFNVKKMKDE